jgi:hypothetical protein
MGNHTNDVLETVNGERPRGDRFDRKRENGSRKATIRKANSKRPRQDLK